MSHHSAAPPSPGPNPTDRPLGTEHAILAGRRLVVEPLRPGDVATVHAVFAQLSDESRLSRFLTPVPRLSAGDAHRLADVDGDRHHAVVVLEPPLQEAEPQWAPRPVALGRLVRTGPARAEVALEVVDAWQGRGLGTLLVERLLRDAEVLGVDVVEGAAAAENRAVLRLVRRHLGPEAMSFGDGLAEFAGRFRVPARIPADEHRDIA